jgi:murein DD-endopeptidase MepM/ murein hydrolase activator NlpD
MLGLVGALASGSSAQTRTTTPRPLAARARAVGPIGPRLVLEPRQPSGGSLVRLTVDGLARDDSVTAISGEFAGEPVHFVAASAGRRQALGALPIDASDSVVARVLVARASGAADTLRVLLHYPHRPPALSAPAVARRSTPSGPARRLHVDSRFTRRVDAETEARIEHENELAREIGRRAQNTPQLWTFPFLRPRKTKVTSRFGSGRVFNGRLSSSHLGVDYRGATGEPIYAANRGVVALVAQFFLAGNVVYVNHGDGLVTGYFHMSRPEVAIGDTVERGQEIGLVGSTGRVTGPHLHWSARFGPLTINPADLLALGAPFTARDTLTKKSLRPSSHTSSTVPSHR